MSSQEYISEGLFSPITIGSLDTKNRFVMAPMTREYSVDGTPPKDSIDYYVKRAQGGIGLIITEGAIVDHPAAQASPNVPHFYGDDSLTRWAEIANAVHAVGGKIIPQIWHVGLDRDPKSSPRPDIPSIGPGEWFGDRDYKRRIMTLSDIDTVIDAFAEAAVKAEDLGFDGVEIHGAHGFLIDQFLWDKTNNRTDQYGGSLVERSRFAAEIIEEVRNRVSPAFPISFRLSQWKSIDFDARPYDTPQSLEEALEPLVESGVSIFHASTRRFWTPEYVGSDLNLAGWTKKLTGLPVITVGSVGLGGSDFVGTLLEGKNASSDNLSKLSEMFERGDFDLVALGRSVISDYNFVNKLEGKDKNPRRPFKAEDLMSLN